MHAHMDDARGALAAIRYITKRMRRIYIPYLPVSIGMIVLYQALPSVSAANRDWGLITSLFLFPTEHPPALSVAWTLVHEMTFYSLFLASYFTRHFAVVICAWAGGIVAAWAAGWVPPTALLRVLLAPINLEFVAGMGAALLVCRVDSSWWPAFFFAGLCSAIVCLWSGVDETTRVWFGPSLAPVVVGLVLIERLGGASVPGRFDPWQRLLCDLFGSQSARFVRGKGDDELASMADHTSRMRFGRDVGRHRLSLHSRNACNFSNQIILRSEDAPDLNLFSSAREPEGRVRSSTRHAA